MQVMKILSISDVTRAYRVLQVEWFHCILYVEIDTIKENKYFISLLCYL